MKTGDVVALRVDDRRRMTVDEVRGNNVACLWFNDGKLHKRTYAKAWLKVVDGPCEAGR